MIKGFALGFMIKIVIGDITIVKLGVIIVNDLNC